MKYEELKNKYLRGYQNNDLVNHLDSVTNKRIIKFWPSYLGKDKLGYDDKLGFVTIRYKESGEVKTTLFSFSPVRGLTKNEETALIHTMVLCRGSTESVKELAKFLYP